MKMNEYYGIASTPTDDFLAHYGIKGMKWGVRKALKKNNMSKLAYHYQKSIEKRNTLKDRTSIEKQKDDAKAYAAGGAGLIGAGALGGLATYGVIKGQQKLNHLIAPNSGYEQYMVPVGLIGTSGLAAAGGLASLGASVASAYRTTKRGHKNAIKKHKDFSKEMDKTFNKSTRSKIQKYLRQHPEERFGYNFTPSNNVVVHPVVPTTPDVNKIKNKKKSRR
ncbi:MAG: hypothetical protein LIR46_06085 [Bacteroidota bacterium]|nr:hypothetical protein [Bacteroidota bacterium]